MKIALVPETGQFASLIKWILDHRVQDASVVSDRKDAEILVLDAESPEGAHCLNRRPDGKKILAVSSRSVSADICVPKPVSIDDFCHGIERMRSMLKEEADKKRWLRWAVQDSRRAPEGSGGTDAVKMTEETRVSGAKTSETTRPDTAASGDVVDAFLRSANRVSRLDSALLREWMRTGGGHYDPNDRLHGVLVQAIDKALRTGFVIRVGLVPHPVWVVPDRKEAWTDLSDEQIVMLAKRPVKILRTMPGVDLTPKPESAPIRPDSVKRRMRLENFLFQVVIASSGGNLVRGIDIKTPLSLRYWPDLPKLTLPPGGVQYCALIHNRPMTPTGAAKTLRIPESHLYAVISGLYAIGAIETRTIEDEQVHETPERTVDDNQVSVVTGILRKLLQKFR